MHAIRLKATEMSRALRRSLEAGIWQEADRSIIFHDLDFLEKRVRHIQNLFPGSFLHAVAAKANPLPRLLERLRRWDVGSEAATMTEARLAEMSGYPSRHIVFDSPAKTSDDLRYALRAGWHLNADNPGELERIDSLLKEIASESVIGLRVNPRVGMGTIAATSVAGDYSKFGLPLDECAESIKQAYARYPWLTAIHVHVGSQGCSLNQLEKGVRTTLDFALMVNETIRRPNGLPPISHFDMGGGMPAAYLPKEPSFTIDDYAQRLRDSCPELFDGRFRVITEFGRFVHANAGFTASRVEYVKSYAGTRTAVIHVGADLLMRRCYMPDQWYHHISVCDAEGRLKETGAMEQHTIAGPLCFNGDLIAKDISLPRVEEGDYVLIHDTGAYTLSMWSRHTSRLIPAVWGYSEKGGFEQLKKGETVEDVYRFWR